MSDNVRSLDDARAARARRQAQQTPSATHLAASVTVTWTPSTLTMTWVTSQESA